MHQEMGGPAAGSGGVNGNGDGNGNGKHPRRGRPTGAGGTKKKNGGKPPALATLLATFKKSGANSDRGTPEALKAM